MKTTATKKQTVTTAKKGEKVMKKSLVEIANSANVEQVIGALATLDIESFRNGTQSNKVKEFVEVLMYDRYIKAGEDAEKICSVTFNEVKIIKTLSTVLPYILGCTYFAIEYSRETKEVIINFKMKRPYGSYKESLELKGLSFVDNSKEVEEVRNAEQQDAIAEANSILAAAGLPFYAL